MDRKSVGKGKGDLWGVRTNDMSKLMPRQTVKDGCSKKMRGMDEAEVQYWKKEKL